MEPDLLGALARGEDPGALGARGPEAGPAASSSSERAGQPTAPADGAPPCSRRGCQAPAAWHVLWNNPRIHTPQRRKDWLACDEHRAYLADFLAQRGFLRDVVAFEAAASNATESATDRHRKAGS